MRRRRQLRTVAHATRLLQRKTMLRLYHAFDAWRAEVMACAKKRHRLTKLVEQVPRRLFSLFSLLFSLFSLLFSVFCFLFSFFFFLFWGALLLVRQTARMCVNVLHAGTIPQP
jgi:cellulose synthase/poly-beta-1,6-N-acetylglucosamine synthase-like glycosyltransferase